MESTKSREIAVKKNIVQLLHETVAEWASGYSARINLIATIVGKEKLGSITNLMIDDGSGKIVLRCFEESKALEQLKISDSVLVIGRVRQYNQEYYISPEIVKKVPFAWLRLRVLELGTPLPVPTLKLENLPPVDEKLLPRQKIIQTIKLLDSGEGVMIGEVIEKVPLADMERWVTVLLEEGDIYQIRPGRVKVL